MIFATFPDPKRNAKVIAAINSQTINLCKSKDAAIGHLKKIGVI